ncbi:MAG: hypothetical protein H7Y61_14210, partial [Rhizobiales bacterium]|nr:hypothetical protein [Rhizobacter sp.]
MPTLCFRRRLAGALLLIATWITPAMAADAPADPAVTQRLHALFEAHWEAVMQRYPQYATYVGDHRYGDRLEDASPAASAA